MPTHSYAAFFSIKRIYSIYVNTIVAVYNIAEAATHLLVDFCRDSEEFPLGEHRELRKTSSQLTYLPGFRQPERTSTSLFRPQAHSYSLVEEEYLS